MTNHIDRHVLADYGFLAALIGLPTLPLMVWHKSTGVIAGWPVVAVLTVWLLLLASWLATVPGAPSFAFANGDCEPKSTGARRVERAIVAISLFLLTLITFWMPLQINFWGGVDDFAAFQPWCACFWSDAWDQALGRPLVGLPNYVAIRLVPDRIEGFLYVGTFLCFMNGWLLYLFLTRLMPRSAYLPAIAAVLLIINRADGLRYFVMWASNHYCTVVFFLLLASWLFLDSYQRQSRFLLVLACIALAGALLSNESTYPTAALVPLVALNARRDWRRYSFWSLAWYGTIALLTVRFLHHFLLLDQPSYQGGHLNQVLHRPSVLLDNLGNRLRPILSYVRLVSLWRDYIGYALGAFVVAVLAVTAAGWRSKLSERVSWRALALAGLTVLCGVLPFVPLYTNDRTQFLVAPAQATLLALLLAWAARFLPARLGAVGMALVTGILAASSTVASARHQQINPSSVQFERMVHLFRQVHAVSPAFLPDTLLVFVLENPERSPAGMNYMIAALSRDLLGVECDQANFHDPCKVVPRFTQDYVIATDGRSEKNFGYEQVVAFRVSEDGTATLLRQLPAFLLPGPGVAANYAPLSRMRPGPVREISYLRYPVWSLRPGDVVNEEEGLMLGEGWSSLIAKAECVYRIGSSGAELLVNPQGGRQRELTLELEPWMQAGNDGASLEFHDDSGAVVAVASLAGRSRVHLTVPLDPERIGVFRLFVRPAHVSTTPEPQSVRFRVFRQGNASAFAPLPPDIFQDGVVPLRGWYHPTKVGKDIFRWVLRDAELDIRCLQGTASELALTIQGAALCRTGPSTLEVCDGMGNVLACRTFRERGQIRVPIPCTGNGILRLHVRDDVKRIANDPKEADYRVFECGAVPQ